MNWRLVGHSVFEYRRSDGGRCWFGIVAGIDTDRLDLGDLHAGAQAVAHCLDLGVTRGVAVIGLMQVVKA